MIAETMSLTNYAWTRNRTATLAVIAVAVVGEIAAVWLSANDGIGPGVLLLSLFPCWMHSLILFDYGNRANLLAYEGGYDRWLLQLPLPTWKLALIPTSLLTLWMACSWGMFALTVRLIGGPALPLVQQALALGAVAIVVTSLAWKPQRWPWQRLATLIVLFPVLYVVLTISLIVEFEAPQWRWAVWCGVVLCYLAANAHAVRSVALARISAFQQRPARSSTRSSIHGSPAVARATARIQFPSATSALRWYDERRSRNARSWLLAVFLLTILPFVVFLLPLSPASAVFAVVMVAFIACSTASTLIESPVARGQSSLPSFLIASPLSSRQIARTRLVSVARLHGVAFVLVSLLLPLCLVWEPNRDWLANWFTSPAWTREILDPLRTMLLIYLAAYAASLGVLLRQTWCQLYGQQWLALALMVVVVAVLLVPFSMLLGWFLVQTDWVTVRETTTGWARQSVHLIWVALSLKLTVLIATIVAAYRRRTELRRGLSRTIARWLAIVVVLGLVMWALWPALLWPDVTFPIGWSLGLAALMVPLSAIIAAPLAVDANRHRGN